MAMANERFVAFRSQSMWGASMKKATGFESRSFFALRLRQIPEPGMCRRIDS